MLKIFAITVLSSVAKASESHEGYTFEQYVHKFKKEYPHDEMEARKTAFDQNLAQIRSHNARPGVAWTETVNAFTADLPADHAARKGIDRALLHHQQHQRRSQQPREAPHAGGGLEATGGKRLPTAWSALEAAEALADLPDHVDWREAGVVTPVKSQGHCGSCWTFAATEALESHIALATGALFTLSEQELVSCVEDPDGCGGSGGCDGATMELAYAHAAAHGVRDEWSWPYTAYQGEVDACPAPADAPPPVAGITGYNVTVSNDYVSLMRAVALAGPVGVTVDASRWSFYAGGVFDGCDEASPELDHGVLLVGYGTDAATGQGYWLVRNSWGPTWGEAGYIRVRRTGWAEGHRCGVDVVPEVGVGCEGGPANVTVCGTCGILYDGSFPTGGHLLP